MLLALFLRKRERTAAMKRRKKTETDVMIATLVVVDVTYSISHNAFKLENYLFSNGIRIITPILTSFLLQVPVAIIMISHK